MWLLNAKHIDLVEQLNAKLILQTFPLSGRNIAISLIIKLTMVQTLELFKSQVFPYLSNFFKS